MQHFMGRNRNQYTLERLKGLYSDLLELIDVSSEDLGRRGTADDTQWEDVPSEENEQEFSLVRVRRVFSIQAHRHRRRRSSPFKRSRAKTEELSVAFRLLAATRSPDKEGGNGGAAVFRDDASVSALAAARAIERKVCLLVRDIGEVVCNGDKTQQNTTGRSTRLTCDPCFEYFCEKNMLSLFVEIVKEKPFGVQGGQPKISSPKHRVVWSALVKAQVMQTISLLVLSGARNSHVFYFILSRNLINDLISSMLPLNQWTDPSLEKLMPAFVDLLKNLSLQLGGTPELFPFFLVEESFPLFHAALEIGTSAYAQTDSFVHITCLNLIINTMKVDNPDVVSWISSALPKLQTLSKHLCSLILNRYYRIADLGTGPIVDGIRCNAIGIQLAALSDQIDVLNDVLSCEIPGLNVRLCEALLRRVISVVLQNLITPRERAFINVGISDSDVIPKRECLAQVSFVFMTQLFRQVEYVPLVRMLAVAMFHPKSTPLWRNYGKQPHTGREEDGKYVIVPALDAIAQGKLKGDTSIENPYRLELVKSLRGCYGEWRFTVAAITMESILWSEAIDIETLAELDIVPSGSSRTRNKMQDDTDDKTEKKEDDLVVSHSVDETTGLYIPTSIEEALTYFIETRSKSSVSTVLKTSLECAGSLSMALIYQAAMSVSDNGSKPEQFHSITFSGDRKIPPLYNALLSAKMSFWERALESQKALGVSNIFLELVESAVCSRYKKLSSARSSVKICRDQQTKYACHLSQIGCAALAHSPEILVRDYRGVNTTDVEEARFNVQMTIHFRSLCKVLAQFSDKLCRNVSYTGDKVDDIPQSISSGRKAIPQLDFVELADEFAITFGGLKDIPDIHTHLDLRGRMIFPCCSASARATETGLPSTVRTLSEDVVLRPETKLILVLDPTDIFVVKPVAKSGANRGTVVCTIALQNIIAAAADGDWLHIAVRHQDIGRLIKNGNMVLQFESSGTCLIVRQYLDRCRSTLRRELMERFRLLLEPEFSDVTESREGRKSCLESWEADECNDHAIVSGSFGPKETAGQESIPVEDSSPNRGLGVRVDCPKITPETSEKGFITQAKATKSVEEEASAEDSEYDTASEQGDISQDSPSDEDKLDHAKSTEVDICGSVEVDEISSRPEQREMRTDPISTHKEQGRSNKLEKDRRNRDDEDCTQLPIVKRV